MRILTDTHSLFWYFIADKKLSKVAKESIDNADNIFIPTVVLAELLYIFNKKKRQDQFYSILSEFKENPKYIVVSLDLGIIEEMIRFSASLEIHDAAIVATASILKLSFLTKDRAIRKIYTNTIW